MSQTDRQTDKATHWAVTAYNSDMDILDDHTKYPVFVKKVYGGRETCPATGRIHFQGHIVCRVQQRLSALKKWLPTAHLEVARNFQASITYAMKADTAAGDKTEKTNATPFVDNQTALKMLAKIELTDKEVVEGDVEDHCFWPRVRKILMTQPHLCGLFAKPDIYRLWKHTWSVWEFHVSEEARESHSITALSSSQNEIIFSPENINAPTCSVFSEAESGEEVRQEARAEEAGGSQA